MWYKKNKTLIFILTSAVVLWVSIAYICSPQKLTWEETSQLIKDGKVGVIEMRGWVGDWETYGYKYDVYLMDSRYSDPLSFCIGIHKGGIDPDFYFELSSDDEFYAEWRKIPNNRSLPELTTKYNYYSSRRKIRNIIIAVVIFVFIIIIVVRFFYRISCEDKNEEERKEVKKEFIQQGVVIMVACTIVWGIIGALCGVFGDNVGGFFFTLLFFPAILMAAKVMK